MLRLSSRSASFVLALVLLPSTVAAAPITTLFNTGVDNAGALLIGNGAIDPHWDVIAGPNIVAAIDAIASNCCYFADGPFSRWITVPGGSTGPSGTYQFRTTFNLAGFDLTQTSIQGVCATDNLLASIQLNGAVVPGDCDSFGSFGPQFTIQSGFAAGLNNLDFFVVDQGSPMAFRAQFTSNTEPLQNGPGPSPVPEPATLTLLGCGAAALLARRRT